jgi:hypothetical protein
MSGAKDAGSIYVRMDKTLDNDKFAHKKQRHIGLPPEEP